MRVEICVVVCGSVGVGPAGRVRLRELSRLLLGAEGPWEGI